MFKLDKVVASSRSSTKGTKSTLPMDTQRNARSQKEVKSWIRSHLTCMVSKEVTLPKSSLMRTCSAVLKRCHHIRSLSTLKSWWWSVTMDVNSAVKEVKAIFRFTWRRRFKKVRGESLRIGREGESWVLLVEIWKLTQHGAAQSSMMLRYTAPCCIGFQQKSFPLHFPSVCPSALSRARIRSFQEKTSLERTRKKS